MVPLADDRFLYSTVMVVGQCHSTYFCGRFVSRFSLARQSLRFQAFPIKVKFLLRFFVVGQSLFCFVCSKGLPGFAFGARRYSSFKNKFFGHL
jgi:hypothetical protein